MTCRYLSCEKLFSIFEGGRTDEMARQIECDLKSVTHFVEVILAINEVFSHSYTGDLASNVTMKNYGHILNVAENLVYIHPTMKKEIRQIVYEFVEKRINNDNAIELLLICLKHDYLISLKVLATSFIKDNLRKIDSKNLEDRDIIYSTLFFEQKYALTE